MIATISVYSAQIILMFVRSCFYFESRHLQNTLVLRDAQLVWLITWRGRGSFDLVLCIIQSIKSNNTRGKNCSSFW